MASISQERSTPERAHQTPKSAYTLVDMTSAVRGLRATPVPSPTSNWKGHGIASLLDPRNFSWPSPTGTVSSVSSPAGSNEIWDLPETPCGQSAKASPSRMLAPLTPPTPSGSPGKSHITPVSKLSRGIDVSPTSRLQLFDKKDTSPQDDQFQPKKLFRNLTLELEAISQKNATAALVNYNINPSFAFTHDTNYPVSSRTRSKTNNKASATSAIYVALDEEKSSIDAPSSRTISSSQNKLQKLLEHIIPLDFHARLSENPGKCVGSWVKNPSERCNYNTKTKGSLEDVSGVLKKLTRCKNEKNYCSMLSHIEELVQAVMCGTHQNTALKQPKDKKRPKAKSKVVELGQLLEDIKHMEEVDRSILTQWLDAISDSHASIDHISWLYTIATNSKPVSQSKVKAATAQHKVRVSVSPNFTPYEPQKTMNLTVSSALHQKATSPLGARDQTPGFIYLFWDKQHFGMVKIGYTKDLTKRLKSWNRDCKREHVYHSSSESQAKMSHVHRVEQLIHTELKEDRKSRRCEGCGKMHKEWFDVAEVHAVKVARKWREWILQEPYAQDADSGQWVIRPEMLDSLERMCEPLPHNMSNQRS